MTKFQSIAFLLLLSLLGTGALVDGNCAKKGDSIVCKKTSNSSSYHTSSSHSSSQTITKHSSTQFDILCVSKHETDVNGTHHFTNCSKSESGGVPQREDTSQAHASESAPSLEEAPAPLPVPPIDSILASVDSKTSSSSSPSPAFFSVCGYHQPSNPLFNSTSAPCVSKNPVQSIPIPSPVQSMPIPSPVQSIPVPSPVQSIPVPSPVQSIPVPSPVQSIPIPSPVQSTPIPSPVQSIPVPSPVQSIPVPSPVQSIPVPLPVQSPVASPTPSSEPLPSLVVVHPKIKNRIDEAPVAALPLLAKRTNFSEVITKRLRSAISSGNFSSVAQEVIESDDIYGLTMGLTFTEREKASALVKTPQRNRDGDVVAIKGLLSASLNKNVKSKVVQLLVLAVTSPTGYHFTQFRPLIQHLTKIVEDNSLLLEIIKANPQTYSRRMLLCAGCSPVHSFVCAHCWPQKLCQVYYWCPKTNTKSSSTSSSSKSPPSKSKSRSSSKEKKRSSKKESNEEEAEAEEEVKGEIEALSSMEAPIIETKQQHSKTKHKTSEFGSKSTKRSTAIDEDQVPN